MCGVSFGKNILKRYWRKMDLIFGLIVMTPFLLCDLMVNANTAASCVEPENVLEQMTAALSDHYTNQNYNMLESEYSNLYAFDYKSKAIFTDLRKSDTKPKTCRRSMLFQGTDSDKSAPINQVATCPWKVVLNTDSDRFPQTIAEAKCSCDKCIERVRSKCPSNRRRCFQLTGKCVPVTTRIPVIRRICKRRSDTYKYVAQNEPIASGCTCVALKNV